MTHRAEHLDRDELRRWRDQPDAADRDRIVAHLAACDACGFRYAEMVRTAPAVAEDTRLDANAFRARGYKALAPPSKWRAALRMPTLVPLAAAAALVLAAGVYLLVPQPSAPVMRGGTAGVELARPSGVTVAAEELRFEWQAPEGTTQQSLRVFDLAALDEPVMSRDDVTSGYVPTAEERQRLRPGVTYRWFIEYRTAGGGSAVSPSATFSIR